MSDGAKKTAAAVRPALNDCVASAAIDWLRRVFCLDKHLVVPGPAGTIAHAQLSFGNSDPWDGQGG